MTPHPFCSDCGGRGNEQTLSNLSRRRFIATSASATVAGALTGSLSRPRVLSADEGKPSARTSETLVQKLHQSLTPAQKEEICFDWDFKDDRGVLRTHVSNNWQITDAKLNVASDFFTKDQQGLIEAIFYGLYNPEWHDRLRTQLKDDAGGYGKHQTIALFGEPGSGKFEFVMTGRHLTIRCDGDSTEHTAFGGPIFYGHAAKGFNEEPGHPGNVYWPQALKANSLYQMLDGKQRDLALVAQSPGESAVGFREKAQGIPVSELSADQKGHVRSLLDLLVEPYRAVDRAEVDKCLTARGGLDACHLTFFKSGDLGNDGVWDIWRLEGPAFVWHFRGTPHVHVWVNIADDPGVKINARG